jgi:EAL domain-containing protein (putative c-di-GMP-specific phosphodiesterase class I)
VQDVAVNQTDAAIVAAIVTLARSLRLEPVAEGVETEAQRSVLLQQGCPFMQGYLFGRPMSADECGRFLTRASAAASAKR